MPAFKVLCFRIKYEVVMLGSDLSAGLDPGREQPLATLSLIFL